MSGYRFRVSAPGAGTYTDVFYNDPSGSYWKSVGEARVIVEGRAPSGARVEYVGQC